MHQFKHMASHARLNIGSSHQNQLIETMQQINKSHGIKHGHSKIALTSKIYSNEIK